MGNQQTGHRERAAAIVVLALAVALAACNGSGTESGPARVQSLQIAALNSPLTPGTRVQLIVTATYTDGAQADVTAQAAWLTSNTAVAAVEPGGHVVAISSGSATITARFGSVDTGVPLTVTGSSGTVAPGYAYVASADAQGRVLPGAVYQYAVAADGSWVPLGTPSVAAGAAPVGIVADPGGRFVYVVNRDDATLSQYAVGPDGGLVPLSPPTVAVSGAGFAFPSVSVEPTGRYLYVVTRLPDPGPSATIAQYSIGANGALSPLVPATVTVPAFAGPLQLDPAGQLAYAVAIDPIEILELSIGPDGTLAALSPGAVATTPNPVTMTMTADGKRTYVLGACVDAACNGGVTEFAIGADGQLTAQGVPTLTGAHANPVALLIDGTGSSAYVLVNQMGVDTNAGAVEQYQITASGALVPYSPGSVGASPGVVAASVYGPNLYVLSANALGFVSGSPPGGNVDRYTVDPSGVLIAAGTTTLAASRPVGMALVPAR